MMISEEDLKCRILRGQIEILDDVTNELTTRWEQAFFNGKAELAEALMSLKVLYTKYRLTIKKEIKETQTRL